MQHQLSKTFINKNILLIISAIKKKTLRDSPGGSVVENLPYNEGNMGSIPGWGTKIPHAWKQLLSPCPKTTDPRDTAREPSCPI